MAKGDRKTLRILLWTLAVAVVAAASVGIYRNIADARSDSSQAASALEDAGIQGAGEGSSSDSGDIDSSDLGEGTSEEISGDEDRDPFVLFEGDITEAVVAAKEEIIDIVTNDRRLGVSTWRLQAELCLNNRESH
jgi:hypothetical protein